MTTKDTTGSEVVEVRLGRAADVAAVARVFSESMPVSVWARLGGRMAEAYVAHFARQQQEILIVADHPRLGIVGALMATMRPSTYKRQLLADNWAPVGRAWLDDVTQRPKVALTLGAWVARGVLGTIQRRRSEPPPVEHLAPSISLPLPDPAFMTVYFVLPAARGHRLAKRMTELCVDELRRRGARWIEAHTNTGNLASLATLRRTNFTAVTRQGIELVFARRIAADAPEQLTIRVLDDPAADASLPAIWAELLARTPEGSGFHSWAWVGEHLAEVRQPRVAVVSRGDRPVAIFPFKLEGKRLTWLAVQRSNYCGPVYDPDSLAAVIEGFQQIVASLGPRTVDLPGLRERSPFFAAVRELELEGLGSARVANTIGCPQIDLRPGWDAIWKRHKSRQRNTWRRKRKKLERLGELIYEELTEAEAILAALPRIVELYEARWEGLNVQKPFAREDQPFQRRAAAALARDRHVQLSVLRLAGEIIAFSYSLRAQGVSSSYTLAHDERYAPYSPGLLLLIELLEHAARRGDPIFDFSLGDAGYKELWSTDRQELFRVAWGAGSRRVTAVDELMAEARRNPRLRELKQRGLRSLVSPRSAPALVDWSVQRLAPLADESPVPGIEVSVMDLAQMRLLLDDERFTLAMARAFRGDRLLLLREAGVARAIVWQVSEDRRALVTGDLVDELSQEVYLHPISLADGVDLGRLVLALGPGLLVSQGPVAGAMLGQFRADQSFRRPEQP